jgi:hypothetical protein
MTKDEALRLALEALKQIDEAMPFPVAKLAQKVIKEALAQPEQKPVAWRYRWSVEGGNWVWNYATYIERQKDDRCEPLYTTPPQRTWVGLTDKDWNRSKHNYDFQKGVDWAESILKEKNT